MAKPTKKKTTAKNSYSYKKLQGVLTVAYRQGVWSKMEVITLVAWDLTKNPQEYKAFRKDVFWKGKEGPPMEADEAEIRNWLFKYGTDGTPNELKRISDHRRAVTTLREDGVKRRGIAKALSERGGIRAVLDNRSSKSAERDEGDDAENDDDLSFDPLEERSSERPSGTKGHSPKAPQKAPPEDNARAKIVSASKVTPGVFIDTSKTKLSEFFDYQEGDELLLKVLCTGKSETGFHQFQLDTVDVVD